jgi:hypothetical protein
MGKLTHLALGFIAASLGAVAVVPLQNRHFVPSHF